MASLATNEANHEELVQAEAIPILVGVLTKGSPDAQAFAAGTLEHLAIRKERQTDILAAGAVEPLVLLLSTGTAKAKENAAGALGNLAVNGDQISWEC